MTVKFIDVGRNKVNWEIQCNKGDVTEEFLVDQIKEKGCLMSSNIWISGNTINAGIRSVGTIELSE